MVVMEHGMVSIWDLVLSHQDMSIRRTQLGAPTNLFCSFSHFCLCVNEILHDNLH